MRSQFFRSAAVGILLCAVTLPAWASPWAEVGDNQLRADIELLQAWGVVDDITTQWPLPWQSLMADLSRADMSAQPASVRAAAERVLARAEAATAPGISAWASLDATNKPGVVYGFDGMGRGEGQAQLSLEGTSGPCSGRVSLGAHHPDLSRQWHQADARRQLCAHSEWEMRSSICGYLDHWWGPGQISALQLSNNARPMPQVGIRKGPDQRFELARAELAGALAGGIFARLSRRSTAAARHLLQRRAPDYSSDPGI